MKHAISISILALVWCTPSILSAQAISPWVSKKYPFQVGTIMDGGTLYILERPTKKTPERRYCIDNQINSKTAGELFVGNLHPTHEGAKLVRSDEARKVLARIVARLEDFHGKEVLERYRKDPIDLEGMSEEEAEVKIKEPAFNDRVATQMLLEAIQEYRKAHKADQAGANQRGAKPQAKSKGK